ncbi:MAG: hypothetical protein XD36_0945 [Halomonas sp. 54_146]|nr:MULTISPECIES: hypothetical protein [unclassified Halomonas]KUJ88708.1 MAG: hypothetical protein XD36_0945 [Halomonas sp. 54_146]HAA44664.1 hypothetical protein [Halomonas sp.]
MGKEAIQNIMLDVEIAENRFEHASVLFDAIARMLESGEHRTAMGLAKLGHEIAREGADDAGELGGSIEQEGGNQ